MATYSVTCPNCGTEMLIEHAQPLEDPGTLPAFCCDACSVSYMKRQWQPFIDAGAILVELDCGCLCLVFDVIGKGHTMPWPVCQQAAAEGRFEHSNQVHDESVAIVRRQIIDAN